MAVWGQDIGEVRQLANQLTTKAEEIQGIMTQLNTRINQVHWTGPDADKFKSDWNGQHVSQLKTVISALRDAGQRAQRNASEQEQTSNA